ncbi:MAG: glycoside hydrolase family 13 protein [Lachnospiraceae bacterium]|nr:glycoside hydrolase family 13 protein [Lachnospiraceae bacterium]
MNKEAVLHTPSSKYCFALNENTVILRLRIARTDEVDSVSVIYGGKYDFYMKQKRLPLTKAYTDNLFCYYQTELKLDDIRLVYIFEIAHNKEITYYSEDGLTDTFDFKFNYFNAFQLAYINAIDVHREVPWMKRAVFYHIFIDRFFIGDTEKDDEYINLKWGESPGIYSFAGGDLKGITKKLDYLSSLGINVLYLTPVFCSLSNHKYDISDYFKIDRQFGSNEDFKELIDKAHQNGIRIVIDAVFNHCGEDLKQFADVVKNGKSSPYFDWFILNGDNPIKEPLNYECFAYCDHMPKFNTSNLELQKHLLEITSYWMEYGIDGWRLDVSDEVSHNFWRKFREHVKGINKDCVIIGENWHDANPFLLGDQYDSIMNYAFTKACYDFFADNLIDAKGFAERLSGLLMRNSTQVNKMMLNILDSHDTHRFLTLVKGNTDKLICALSVTFMYVGAASIYYGTEIGLEGGHDPDSRRTFDWQKVDEKDQLFKIIKGLASLKENEVLSEGGIKLYSEDGLFVLERFLGQKTLTLRVNNTATDIKCPLTGTEVLSHNFTGTVLKSNGFMIET